MSDRKLSQLRQLEAESIQIIREAAAEFENPGDDVLRRKRLDGDAAPGREGRSHRGPLPFPLLHVDTTWKFQGYVSIPGYQVEANLKGELIKYTSTPKASRWE